jgi:hypothetical protein
VLPLANYPHSRRTALSQSTESFTDYFTEEGVAGGGEATEPSGSEGFGAETESFAASKSGFK